MAQKCIRVSLSNDKESRDTEVERLEEEGNIVKRLGTYRHIVTFVGTYWKESFSQNRRVTELHILTFPLAICDLSTFLEDCLELRRPRRYRLGEYMNKATDRVFSLRFRVGKPIEKLLPDLNERLMEIMRCLANAISWMHSRLIQHRDIKPANVLLRLAQVYVIRFWSLQKPGGLFQGDSHGNCCKYICRLLGTRTLRRGPQ